MMGSDGTDYWMKTHDGRIVLFGDLESLKVPAAENRYLKGVLNRFLRMDRFLKGINGDAKDGTLEKLNDGNLVRVRIPMKHRRDRRVRTVEIDLDRDRRRVDHVKITMTDPKGNGRVVEYTRIDEPFDETVFDYTQYIDDEKDVMTVEEFGEHLKKIKEMDRHPWMKGPRGRMRGPKHRGHRRRGPGRRHAPPPPADLTPDDDRP